MGVVNMSQIVLNNDIIVANISKVNERPKPAVRYWGVQLNNSPTFFELPGYYPSEDGTEFFVSELTNKFREQRAYRIGNEDLQNVNCFILRENFLDGKNLGAYCSVSSLGLIEDIPHTNTSYFDVYVVLCDNENKVVNTAGGPIRAYCSYPTDSVRGYVLNSLVPSETNPLNYFCFALNSVTNKIIFASAFWTGDVNSRIYIPLKTLEMGNPVYNSYQDNDTYYELYTAGYTGSSPISWIPADAYNDKITDYSTTSTGYGTWDTSSDDIGLP